MLNGLGGQVHINSNVIFFISSLFFMKSNGFMLKYVRRPLQVFWHRRAEYSMNFLIKTAANSLLSVLDCPRKKKAKAKRPWTPPHSSISLISCSRWKPRALMIWSWIYRTVPATTRTAWPPTAIASVRLMKRHRVVLFSWVLKTSRDTCHRVLTASS